jgi:glycosyltransferase involved in cell wall biosynthesis
VKQLLELLLLRGVDAHVFNIGKGRPSSAHVETLTSHALHLELSLPKAGKGLVHLHTSGNNLKSWWRALGVGLSGLRQSRVMTLHSGKMPEFLGQAAQHRMWAQAALSRFGNVIVVSDAMRASIQLLVMQDTHLHVLPAFLPSMLKIGELPMALEKVKAQRWPLLAMAHHPSSVYGTDVALEAIERMKDRFPEIGLVLFGPQSDDAKSLPVGARQGLSTHIIPLGSIEHARALAVMRECDVFLRPTRIDGDSISVREALSLGVRCVASNAVARPSGTVLFESGNADSLAEAISRALSSRPRAMKGVDAEAGLMDLYRRLLSKEGEVSESGKFLGASWAGLGGVFQRLGGRSTFKSSHHALVGEGKSGALGQQHRQSEAPGQPP